MGTSLYPPRVRAHFEAYAQIHKLPAHQRCAAWAIIQCRTAALGGHIQACLEVHVKRVVNRNFKLPFFVKKKSTDGPVSCQRRASSG
jgi:hypothetical protein